MCCLRHTNRGLESTRLSSQGFQCRSVVNMGDAKVFVDTKIAGKKVVVFSKTHCPFCTKAKKALQKHVGKELAPEDYEVIEIEDMSNCGAIQDYLLELTKGRSVPRVFIKQKFIGGGDDVAALEGNGKLAQMLA